MIIVGGIQVGRGLVVHAVLRAVAMLDVSLTGQWGQAGRAGYDEEAKSGA